MKVNKLLEIAHLGCGSHLFNLDMQNMLFENVQLNIAVDVIKSTMVQCKEFNVVALCKLTDLKVEIDNKTHWSGKNKMIIK